MLNVTAWSDSLACSPTRCHHAEDIVQDVFTDAQGHFASSRIRPGTSRGGGQPLSATTTAGHADGSASDAHASV